MDDQSLNAEPGTWNRELEEALNVDPSPEFLARIRTRIASEPEPRRWRLAWVMVPVTTAAIAMFGVLTMVGSRPEPVAPFQVATDMTPGVLERRSAPGVVAPAIVREPMPPQRRVVAHLTPSSVFPEVVVSQDERRTLDYVAAVVIGGRIADLSVERAHTEIEPITVRDVEIVEMTGLAPLRIEPLKIERLEGERQ